MAPPVTRARDFLAIFKNRIPSAEELEILVREEGYEVTAKVFEQVLFRSPLNANFIRSIHRADRAACEADINSLRLQRELVIVPSVMRSGRHGLEWGEHVEDIRRLARSWGWTTEVVDTFPDESISGNARRIGDYLLKSTSRNIDILSISRGSAEVRYLFQRRGEQSPEFQKVKTWISVAGVCQGSRWIELQLQSLWKRNLWKHWGSFHEMTWTAAQEIKKESPFFKSKFPRLDRTLLISLIGLLPSAKLAPRGLRSHADRLACYGPHDGLVLAEEALLGSGLVYPIWGMSHQLEEFRLFPVLERLFSLLRSQQLQRLKSLEQGFTAEVAVNTAQTTPPPIISSALPLQVQDVSKDQRRNDAGIAFNNKAGSIDSKLAPSDFFVRNSS